MTRLYSVEFRFGTRSEQKIKCLVRSQATRGRIFEDPIAEKYGATFVHDLLLASLFFAVVLSPLAINAWQDWVEGLRLRREAEDVAGGLEVGAALVE